MKTLGIMLAAVFLSSSLGASASMTANPDQKPDGSWISIGGTVSDVTPRNFKLNYGDGKITVEMDNWATYGRDYLLNAGDHVTVYGRVDDDLFQKHRIEASSVYVEGLDSVFYATPADEVALGHWNLQTPVVLGQATLIGTVASVDPATDSFVVDSGLRDLTVDTDTMAYDPLDADGYQRIKPGDLVSVSGEVDLNVFDRRVIDADSVVTLEHAPA